MKYFDQHLRNILESSRELRVRTAMNRDLPQIARLASKLGLPGSEEQLIEQFRNLSRMRNSMPYVAEAAVDPEIDDDFGSPELYGEVVGYLAFSMQANYRDPHQDYEMVPKIKWEGHRYLVIEALITPSDRAAAALIEKVKSKTANRWQAALYEANYNDLNVLRWLSNAGFFPAYHDDDNIVMAYPRSGEVMPIISDYFQEQQKEALEDSIKQAEEYDEFEPEQPQTEPGWDPEEDPDMGGLLEPGDEYYDENWLDDLDDLDEE